MAAEMEDLKRHVKGKDVVRVGDHSERTQPCRSCSQSQRRTPSISITRSYKVGDSDAHEEKSSAQDSTYRPSRPATTSRYSYSAHSEDLRAVLKKWARRWEAQRVPAFQRLSYRVRASEEVRMPPPRLAKPCQVCVLKERACWREA